MLTTALATEVALWTAILFGVISVRSKTTTWNQPPNDSAFEYELLFYALIWLNTLNIKTRFWEIPS